MTKTEQIKLIRETFLRLNRILEHSRDDNSYLALCEVNERDHRRHTSFGTKFGISVKVATELSYCRNVLCYVAQERHSPDAADFFSYNGSVFGGYAMYLYGSDKIGATFTKEEAEQFMLIDYSELVA